MTDEAKVPRFAADIKCKWADADGWVGVEPVVPDEYVAKLEAELAMELQQCDLHRQVNQGVSDALGQGPGDSWHDLGEKVSRLRKENAALRLRWTADGDGSLTSEEMHDAMWTAGFDVTFEGLTEFLDEVYPRDVFDGSSGDPGPEFIVAVRAALDRLAERRASAEEGSDE